ncbi:MAG: hypothetical protein ABI263_01920, partial [Gelidibacter sp.]
KKKNNSERLIQPNCIAYSGNNPNTFAFEKRNFNRERGQVERKGDEKVETLTSSTGSGQHSSVNVLGQAQLQNWTSNEEHI